MGGSEASGVMVIMIKTPLIISLLQIGLHIKEL